MARTANQRQVQEPGDSKIAGIAKVFIAALLTLTVIGIVMVGGSAPTYSVAIRQWQSTTPLPQAISSQQAVVHDGYVFLIGGKLPSGDASGRVYTGNINAVGGIDAWSTTTSLPQALFLHAVAATDTHVYVVGGYDGKETIFDDVYRAPFAGDGQLGAWQSLTSFPFALDLTGVAVIGDRIYVAGGFRGFDGDSRRVYFSTITDSGISAWQETTGLPEARYRHTMTAVNGRLYVVGGVSGADAVESHATVYRAVLNGNGTIDRWVTETPLPDARYYHQTVLHDGRLVVLGGANGAGANTIFSTVYSAPVKNDGSLSGWTNEPNLPEVRYRFGAAVERKYGSEYIYVIGGLVTDDDYRRTVYHSAVPPTPTPTMTPTPTPTPGIEALLQNNPGAWVPPGGQVEYTISYMGNGIADFSTASIVGTVPENVELLPDSIVTDNDGAVAVDGDGGPGTTIEWRWPDGLPQDVTGAVSYRVRRPVAPTPVVPPALFIEKIGPSTASPGASIAYTLTVVNNLPVEFTDVEVRDRLPAGATYVSGGDGPPENGVVRWTIPALAPDEVRELAMVVTADTTIVNSDYSVRSAATTPFQGTRVVVTTIGGTEPPPGGDGIAITNQGAIVRWTREGAAYGVRSNGVRNPKYDVFLPLITAR